MQILVGILVLVAVFAVGGYTGWDYRAAKCDQDKKEALEAEKRQAAENAVVDMQAAVEADRALRGVQIIYRDRNARIEESLNVNPPPRECRVSDDTVRLLNESSRGATPLGSESKPMPAPAAPPKRGDGSTSADLRGDDSGLRRVRSENASVDRVVSTRP